MNKRIEKLEIMDDPYRGGFCLANKSMKWYAPEGDLSNQIDIIRKTMNQIIDYLNKEKE